MPVRWNGQKEVSPDNLIAPGETRCTETLCCSLDYGWNVEQNTA